MTSQQRNRSLLSAPVLLLAAVAFVVGTAEFVAIGLVPELARDLDTSVGAAGLTVTLYALSVGLLAVPLGLVLAHRNPRGLLATLMLVFAVSNVVAAAAPGLTVLLVARVASAATQGVALGVAVSAVTSLVAPHLASKAVSLVFGGLMSAMFLGAPLGTFLGGIAGWRVPFAALGLVGVLLAIGLWIVLDRAVVTDTPSVGGVAQLRTLTIPGVLGLLGVATAIIFAASLFFPYLGAYLEEESGLGSTGISLGLAVFGVAGLVGNALGGVVAGRNDTLWVTGLAGVVLLAVTAIATSNGAPYIVLPALAVWGAAQMAALPIVTASVVALGGAFAATLNVALVNLGIAGAGFVGGWFSDTSITILPWMTVSTFAVLVVVLAVRHARTARVRKILPDAVAV